MVPINTRYKTDELRYCLGQSGCRALLAPDTFLGIDFRAMVAATRADLPALEWVAYPDELRALAAAPPLPPERWPALSPDDVGYLLYTSGTTSFAKGVQLTHRELMTLFESLGVTAVEPLGERFDPAAHQAIVHEPAPGFEPGTVSEVFRKGYRYRDRLLRAALVKVASGPQGEGPEGGDVH